MKKYIVILVLSLLMSVAVYASMSQKIIPLASGEYVDLASQVTWPAEKAAATLVPPASVNGQILGYVEFGQGQTVVVYGPTTIYLVYGSPTPYTTPSAEK